MPARMCIQYCLAGGRSGPRFEGAGMYRLLEKIVVFFAIVLPRELERRAFYWLAKVAGRPHPKHEFNYRYRDFAERVEKSDRVADLGCGSGALARMLAEKSGYVLGMDFSVRAEVSASPGLEFRKGDITGPGCLALLREKNIDTVVLSHVLEHLRDRQEFLARFIGFPKILICVPSRETWRTKLLEKHGFDHRSDADHKIEYSKAELLAEIEGAGLRLEECLYNSEGELFARASG